MHRSLLLWVISSTLSLDNGRYLRGEFSFFVSACIFTLQHPLDGALPVSEMQVNGLRHKGVRDKFMGNAQMDAGVDLSAKNGEFDILWLTGRFCQILWFIFLLSIHVKGRLRAFFQLTIEIERLYCCIVQLLGSTDAERDVVVDHSWSPLYFGMGFYFQVLMIWIFCAAWVSAFCI